MTPFGVLESAMDVLKMNKKQRELIIAVQEMIDGTLSNYDKDPTHAPAYWLLENWWNTLQAALESQVGNHCDSKLNSFEPTDQAESKK